MAVSAKLIGIILIGLEFTGVAWAGGGPDLPDREVTPGAADPSATVNDYGIRDICHTTTGGIRAQLQVETKKQAFQRYAVSGNCTGYCSGPQGCEIDHLISLELGGSNAVENLWPQQYDGTRWNAHVKDHLELKLNAMVCNGALTLEEAQRAVATDWIATFKKYFGDDPSFVSPKGKSYCSR